MRMSLAVRRNENLQQKRRIGRIVRKYGQQGTFSAHGSSSQEVVPPTLSSPELLQSLLVAKGELVVSALFQTLLGRLKTINSPCPT